MYVLVCACALYLCDCVCVCVVRVPVRACVHKVKIYVPQEWYIQLCVVCVHKVKVYHRSGTFNGHSSLAI